MMRCKGLPIAAMLALASIARAQGGTIGGGSGSGSGAAAAGTLTGTTLASGVTASSLTSVTGFTFGLGTLTGGAASLTIQSGTGVSRTFSLQSTTSGSVATTFLTGNADQSTTFANRIKIGNGTAAIPSISGAGDTTTGIFFTGPGTATNDTVSIATAGALSLGIRGGASATIFGGAGNMTVQCGTGNSRTCTFQSTTSAGTAKNTLVLGADTSATFLGQIKGIAGNVNLPAYSFGGTTGWYGLGSDTIAATTSAAIGLKICCGGTGITKIIGPTGSGNGLTIAAAGSSGRLVFQTTTSGSTATTFLRANELQQSLFASGSAATPGIGFAADTIVGLSLVGTAGASDSIRVSVNGIAQMKIGAVGVLLLPALPAEGATKNAVCWDAVTFNVTQNGAATCTVSSARFKQNIRAFPVADALRIVDKLHASSYSERQGGRLAIGIIAEQADTADWRLASRDAKGVVTSTNYEEITSLLVTVVKDQQRRIDALEARQSSQAGFGADGALLLLGIIFSGLAVRESFARRKAA